MNTPTLTTERLILRKFMADDIEDLYRIHRDAEVNQFLPWFPLTTIEDAWAFYRKRYESKPDHNLGRKRPDGHTCYESSDFHSKYSQQCPYHYAICLKENNRPIGYINVDMNDSHDFGYGLCKEFWRKGIVTEAGIAVIEQLKKDGIPYITATHDVNNPRSGAVMKRLGMVYQYTYEEQWQPKDFLVRFRMYQLNLDGNADRVYKEYWNNSTTHFVETDV